jgi:ATP-dependent Lon protease
MPRDSPQVKQSKMDKKKSASRKQDEIKNKKKKSESSDDDSDESSYEEEEEEEEMDSHEYRKFLQKIFPSKHLGDKIDAGEKLKKKLKDAIKKKEREEEESEDSEEEEENIVVKRKKSSTNKKTNKKKQVIEDSESEEEDDDDIEEELEVGKGSNKFNIIFTIANGDEEEDEWEDDDSEWVDEDEETENEDDSVSTSEDDDEEEEEEEEEVPKKRSTRLKERKDRKEKDGEDEKNETVESDDFMKEMKELKEKYKGHKMAEDCLKMCESKQKESRKKQERKLEKTKERNTRIFKRIIRDKNTMNDSEFFGTLAIEEQKKIIKEVKEVNKIIRVETPYRLTLLEANIPHIFKAAAMKKISSLRYMEPGSGEYFKMKNWVDTFMRIPFNKIEKLPINISDGVEVCHDFMEKAQQTLNDAVYGLNDAKIQIMQMLGQLITNPDSIGTAIAIKGPMGTGKTTLVKDGISKILNRPFAFIALGGATDSSFLEGHSYTYEGSVWGKIVQILIDSKCMNPVIYFDELDKISDTPKGEEIAGILTHLTDTTQNSQFHDKYFAEIDFDLSKCLFIFSYNDESKINPILRDRMYRIQTKGYDKKQKTVISNGYLLPKIREQVKFASEDITIPDATLHYIIETHCGKEDGVRNLKRCLEIIYTKLNLYRLMRPGTNLFEEDMALKVEFPFTVTNEIVDKLIKKEQDNVSLYGLYV